MKRKYSDEEILADMRRRTEEKEQLIQELRELIKPRWIPVEERLPEKEGRYWCTYSDGTADTGLFLIFRNGGSFQVPGYAQRINPELRVIAWMLLPEPYRPETLRAAGQNADTPILRSAT